MASTPSTLPATSAAAGGAVRPSSGRRALVTQRSSRSAAVAMPAAAVAPTPAARGLTSERSRHLARNRLEPPLPLGRDRRAARPALDTGEHAQLLERLLEEGGQFLALAHQRRVERDT